MDIYYRVLHFYIFLYIFTFILYNTLTQKGR